MKILLITAILLITVFLLVIAICEIKFNYNGYDILLKNRFTELGQGWGYGIHYKGGLEVWIFARTVHGGLAERPIYPTTAL